MLVDKGETYEVFIGDLVGLSPSAHYERVVEGQNSNNVNSLGLELREILNVAWQVAYGASRSEGAWRNWKDVLDRRPMNQGRIAICTHPAQRRGRPSCRPTLWRHCS